MEREKILETTLIRRFGNSITGGMSYEGIKSRLLEKTRDFKKISDKLREQIFEQKNTSIRYS